MSKDLCDVCTVALGDEHDESSKHYDDALSLLHQTARKAIIACDPNAIAMLSSIITDYRMHVIPDCHREAIN